MYGTTGHNMYNHANLDDSTKFASKTLRADGHGEPIRVPTKPRNPKNSNIYPSGKLKKLMCNIPKVIKDSKVLISLKRYASVNDCETVEICYSSCDICGGRL